VEPGKSQCVKWEQDHLSALYSLTVCEFSRSGITSDTYAAPTSAATGWNINYDELLKYGERIWNFIRMFTDKDFNKLLDWYFEARGWGKNGGTNEK